MKARAIGRWAACLAVAMLGQAAIANSASAFEPEKYAIESASLSLTSTQAGAHADLTTAFALSEKENTPYALTRDVDVHLPPGAIGNPQAVPRCTTVQFGGSTENTCPVNTQVGVVEVTLGGDTPGSFIEPIYNLEPPKNSDIIARFGFYAALYPSVVNVRLDPTNYSVLASAEGVSAAAGIISAKTTIWGIPAAALHDELRITPKEALEGGG